MPVQDEPGKDVAAGGLASLEVDEVAGPSAAAHQATNRVAWPEPEVPPLTGLEQEVVEAVEGDLAGSLGRDEPIAWPLPAWRRSCRTTTTASRSAARIRWRVDLAMPSKAASSPAPGVSGRATR